MWFASIWIFTFRLPWRIGADFFYRHLLDGDPASNTCSWRWVAGLHTQGKTYQAQAWNIEKFTGGRFRPDPRDLAEVAVGLDEVEEPEGLPPVAPLRTPLAPRKGAPSVLLITEEDCSVEDIMEAGFDIRAVATCPASHLRSPRPVSPGVAAFERRALADATRRIGAEPVELRPEEIPSWAASHDAAQIITGYIPEGPLRDALTGRDAALVDQGAPLTERQRHWDRLVWPHCTAGFFKVKQKIPRLIDAAGLNRQPALF